MIEINISIRIIRKMNIKINDLLLKDIETLKIIGMLIEIYEKNDEEKLISTECISFFFDNSINNYIYNSF